MRALFQSLRQAFSARRKTVGFIAALACAATIVISPSVASASPAAPSASLHPTGIADINGDLVDQNENPIDGVTVELLDSTQSVVLTATSNLDGHYSFDDVADGSYTLHFTAPNISEEWWENKSNGAWDATYFDYASGDLLTKNATLQTKSARITGHVHTLANQAPVAGANVVFKVLQPDNVNFQEVGSTTTSADGSYSSPLLVAGNYKVDFNATDLNFQKATWSENGDIRVGESIELVDEEVRDGINANLEPGSILSGTIYCQDSSSPCSADVTAEVAAGAGEGGWAGADSDGHFQIKGLAPGKYKLSFQRNGKFAWWGGDSRDTADVIELGYTDVTEGLEEVLPWSADSSASGSEVSGSITNSIGVIKPNYQVSIIATDQYGFYGSELSVMSDENGQFSFAGVPDGDYYARIRPQIEDGFGDSQYWPSALSLSASSSFKVRNGEPLESLNFVLLSRTGIVTGTVRTNGNAPLAGTTVTARLGDRTFSTITASGGTYRIDNLPPGEASIGFSKTGYNSETGFGNEQTVFFTTLNTTQVNFTLNIANSVITGRVVGADNNRGLSGVHLMARRTTDSCIAGFAQADDQGNYRFENLLEGNYVIAVNTGFEAGCGTRGDGMSAINSTYAGAISPAFSVGRSKTLTGKNFSLARGATIHGSVTYTANDGNVVPAKNVMVNAGNSGSATTDASGSYSISGLAPGIYDLSFRPAQTSLATGYWASSPGIPSVPITIRAGDSFTANKALQESATVSGEIMNGAGQVRVFDLNGRPALTPDYGSVSTNSYGKFQITGLEPGTYTFMPYCGGNNYFGYQQNMPGSLTLQVSPALRASGVPLNCLQNDFSGKITGKIVDSAGKPITQGVTVINSDNDGNDWAQTLPDGTFTVSNLAPGNYSICYDSTFQASNASACFGGGTDPSNAEFFALSTDETKNIGTFTVPAASGFISPGHAQLSANRAIGTNVTLTTTGMSPAPQTTSFHWRYDHSSRVAGTGHPFKIRPEDAGHQIWVDARLYKPGYPAAMVSSFVEIPLATFSASPTPALSGAARVGTVLVSNAGNWSPAPDLVSTQWLRDGEPIQTAAGPAYVLTAADLGHRISSRTIAKKLGYASQSKTSVATASVTLQPLATTPTPTISGTARAGSLLSATPGAWAPAAVGLSYQWKSDGVPIDGASNSKYMLTANETGHRVTVTVTGSKPGFQSVSKTSAQTSTVAAAPPTAFSAAPAPAVSGAPLVGQTLTASNFGWIPTPDTLTYQWLRNGSPIVGATSTSYTLVAADLAKQIRFLVTAKKTGFVTSYMASEPQIVAPGMINGPDPVISGNAAVGSTLTATASISGVAKSFMWLRNGMPIWYASGSRYTVTSLDAGATISVYVTYIKPGYSTEYAESNELAIP